MTNILSGILPLFEVDPCASQLVMLAAISGDTLDFCGWGETHESHGSRLMERTRARAYRPFVLLFTIIVKSARNVVMAGETTKYS